MTAILGYISDDDKSLFLASDGLVIWHSNHGDKPQYDYKKINKFRNFLISFHGEVSFYETFLNYLKKNRKKLNKYSRITKCY